MAVLGLLACGVSAQQQRFELLIRGGTVFDGDLLEGRRADVGVRAGRIAAIGALDGARATTVVDAEGLVVAPGFIDVHAHADLPAARRGEARNFVLMGVTSIVTGNCGGSVEDLEAHFAEVERRGISLNYASLVGHGTVRRAVLGTENRAPTAEELDEMRGLVRRAMEVGAVGMSTGLIYVPGTYADTDELVALSEVVAEFGGVYASHMRNEAAHVLDAIDEALEIGERAGVHVHLSHLKASGKPNWGRGEAIVAKLRAAREAGRRVTGDQYAYTASSTGLEVLFPSEALSGGRRDFGRRLADDPEFRTAMQAALRESAETSGFGGFGYAQIASAPKHTELSGLRIDAAAQRLLEADDLDAQLDAVIRLMIDADGSRVQMVYHKMCEEDVETIMREPYIGVAADAGIRMYRTTSKPHPRGAGNNPRVLGRYVRERGVIPLGLAIQKMTKLPAEVFGLAGRGVIRENAWADLVVFAPETVADRATYEDPLAAPIGIEAVIVNGVVVVRSGEHTKARPGMVLRRE